MSRIVVLVERRPHLRSIQFRNVRSPFDSFFDELVYQGAISFAHRSARALEDCIQRIEEAAIAVADEDQPSVEDQPVVEDQQVDEDPQVDEDQPSVEGSPLDLANEKIARLESELVKAREEVEFLDRHQE